MSRAPDTNGWVALSDVEWMNIVNHDSAYVNMGKEDAVHAAVKATEEKLREINVAANSPTLRDYFAAKAMAALIGHESKDYEKRGPKAVPLIATFAYEYADAMLAERAK